MENALYKFIIIIIIKKVLMPQNPFHFRMKCLNLPDPQKSYFACGVYLHVGSVVALILGKLIF